MDKRPDIEKKAEKALESLDNVKRAEPQPFFYTRLRARSYLARPAVAIVGLCLILAFNVVILVQKETTPSPTSFVETPQEDDNIFAVNTYDYENLEP